MKKIDFHTLSERRVMLLAGWLAACAVFAGCAEGPAVPDSRPRISGFPCKCGDNWSVRDHVSNETVSVEGIGMRYVVETHHYFPGTLEGGGRIRVAVGYPVQYVRKGEPTDTSISNKTCFCGGPWEFVTNGYFACERVTVRAGMNCCTCGGYVWKTNTVERVVGGKDK